jgi:hypothetical protein
MLWDPQKILANFNLHEHLGGEKWLQAQLHQLYNDSRNMQDSILLDDPLRLIHLREKLLAYYHPSKLEPMLHNLKETRAHRSLSEIQDEATQKSMLTYFQQLKREQITREEITRQQRQKQFGTYEKRLTKSEKVELYNKGELEKKTKIEIIVHEEHFRIQKSFRRSLVAILDARTTYELPPWELQQIRQQIIKTLPFDPTLLDQLHAPQ